MSYDVYSEWLKNFKFERAVNKLKEFRLQEKKDFVDLMNYLFYIE